MDLSENLQLELKNIGSKIQLAQVANPEYATLRSNGRNFNVKYNYDNTYLIRLCEENLLYKYNFCHGKIVINNLLDVAQIASKWIDESIQIILLKGKYKNLLLFEALPSHDNPTIENYWIKIQNRLFAWAFNNSKDKFYFELIKNAKKHFAFTNYFPFTSHDSLRFSLDEKITHTWTLDHVIDVYETQDGYKYGVTLSFENGEKRLFEDVNAALDFYAEILKTNPPINWKKKNKQ